MRKADALALSSITKEKRDRMDQELGTFSSMRYFDREGNPCTFGEWAALCEVVDYKIVCETFVDLFRISTVWLGLDHGFRSPQPIIFESMVFDWSVVNTIPAGGLFTQDYHHHPTIDALGEGGDT